MNDSYNHCVRVSCSKSIYKETELLDPGTYLLCGTNHNRSSEETFCSIPKSNPQTWFNDLNLETYFYGIFNLSQRPDDCLINHKTYVLCNNNSYCCFSNNSEKLMQETSCSEFPNCSTLYSEDFSVDEENFGKLVGKIVLVFFLLVGLVAVFGNLAVIIHSFTVLLKTKFKKVSERQIYHVLILNLSLADFAMGFYVLGIIASSINYFNNHSYGDEANKNAGTFFCMFIGLVNFASSQISVTAIATITGLRLFSVLYPYKPVRLRSIFKLVIFTWIFWIIIALLPACSSASLNSVFANDIRIEFEETSHVKINYNRLYSMLERMLEGINNHCGFSSNNRYQLTRHPSWEDMIDIAKKLKLMQPDVEKRLTYLGYYNGQWVCTMKFFLTYRSLSSLFTLHVVLFNVFCFTFILIAQIIIARKTSSCCNVWSCLGSRCYGDRNLTKNAVLTKQRRREIENRQMHRRMFFIVITDFCCWIPLSLLTLDFYIKSYFTPACEFLKVTRRIELWFPALIMLVVPINSSINPFIYSFRFWKPFFRKFNYFRWCCKKDTRTPVSSFQTTDTSIEVAMPKVDSNATSKPDAGNFSMKTYANETFRET